MMDIISCGHETTLSHGVIAATAAYSIGLNETSLTFDLTGGANANASLPQCMAAAGRFYSVILLAADGHDVYVQTNGADPEVDAILDGATKTDSITLNANNEYVLLFSTGRNWVVVNKKVA